MYSTYGNGANTLSFFKAWGLVYRHTDIRMDGKSCDNQNFEIDVLPNFLRYGDPLTRRSFAISTTQTVHDYTCTVYKQS